MVGAVLASIWPSMSLREGRKDAVSVGVRWRNEALLTPSMLQVMQGLLWWQWLAMRLQQTTLQQLQCDRRTYFNPPRPSSSRPAWAWCQLAPLAAEDALERSSL